MTRIVPGIPPLRGEPRPTPARPLTIKSRLSASHQIVRFSASSSSRVRNSCARSQISGGSVTCASQSNVAKSLVIAGNICTGIPSSSVRIELAHTAASRSGSIRRPRESGDPGPLLHPMMPKRPCVYILASQRNGTLYVGVTSDIARRVWEHRSNADVGFVQDYSVYRFVFAEFHETMAHAILREKRIKKWRRAWKLELIERHNPQWHDLYDELAI